MAFEETLKQLIKDAANKIGVEFSLDEIVIEHSKDPSHGDFATNVAFKLTKTLHCAPQVAANKLVEVIDKDQFEKIEIAGPGFINFFLKKATLSKTISDVIEQGENFGRGEKKNQKINIEFVSANPTGNLHVGHARCAAYGDSLARIISFAGYDVTREFYVNDAGAQIGHLGESIYQRYRELFGFEAVIPEDGYQGKDVIEIAKLFKEKYGDSLLERTEENIRTLTREGMHLELENIKKDLAYFGIVFDVYSFETDVRANGGVEKVLNEYKDYLYVEEGATFLKTTAFLDDKDRPVIKSNGDYTYFLPDIAYHLNKLSRGFDKLIDILGADHHGYINRMKSALMMKGFKEDTLEVALIQVVRLMKDGEEVKMSKRTGNAITLRELCDEVGVDAVRYFFVSRSNTSHLDFDFDLAKKASSENPVYYAQYAHARLATVLNNSTDIEIDVTGSEIKEKSEIELLKQLQEFPKLVSLTAETKEVQKVTAYIQKLATCIHGFYTECRVINRDDIKVTQSRLGLVKASKIVLENALCLIGVSAPDKM